MFFRLNFYEQTAGGRKIKNLFLKLAGKTILSNDYCTDATTRFNTVRDSLTPRRNRV
jgi:hypothetical protein